METRTALTPEQLAARRAQDAQLLSPALARADLRTLAEQVTEQLFMHQLSQCNCIHMYSYTIAGVYLYLYTIYNSKLSDLENSAASPRAIWSV